MGLYQNIPLMEEILHPVRLVVYPIVYRVSYIPGGDRQISSIKTYQKTCLGCMIYDDHALRFQDFL